MYALSMKDSTKDALLYCKNLIKNHDDATYLQLAFLPEERQQPAIAYYALNAELKHIHHHVSEEMIGHIRFAWWQEQVEAITQDVVRGHPVLQEIAASGVAIDSCAALVEAYREAYPAMLNNPPVLDIPEEYRRWHKAGRVIAEHRGGRKSLIFKLLFV